jgi:hypothetical protein
MNSFQTGRQPWGPARRQTAQARGYQSVNATLAGTTEGGPPGSVRRLCLCLRIGGVSRNVFKYGGYPDDPQTDAKRRSWRINRRCVFRRRSRALGTRSPKRSSKWQPVVLRCWLSAHSTVTHGERPIAGPGRPSTRRYRTVRHSVAPRRRGTNASILCGLHWLPFALALIPCCGAADSSRHSTGCGRSPKVSDTKAGRGGTVG